MSSVHTSINISIEELNALEILASKVTILPLGIGCSKETLFTEAVTHVLCACLFAVIAAVISIQCNNLPPIRLFKLFVSLGNTISVKFALDCFGVFACYFDSGAVSKAAGDS